MPAYPDVPTQAAALLYSFVKGHPYIDGNKRYGFGLMLAFLETNGWRLEAHEPQISARIRRVAASASADRGTVIAEFGDWLAGRVRRVTVEEL